jgi:hypothetical protein
MLGDEELKYNEFARLYDDVRMKAIA